MTSPKAHERQTPLGFKHLGLSGFWFRTEEATCMRGDT